MMVRPQGFMSMVAKFVAKFLTGAIPMADEPFTISGYLDAAGNIIDEITGTVDDVRIYKKALSQSEIQAIYQAAPPLPTSTDAIPNGIYSIINDPSNRCMDVFGSGLQDGADVIQWGCHGGNNQKWLIEKMTAGYRLVAQHSNKVMDVANGSMASGANVAQWTWNAGNNQQWTVRKVAGGYNFVAVHSNLCLSVASGSLTDGASLQQATCSNSGAQLFKLDPPPAEVSSYSQKGSWGSKISFPIVPVAAAMLPNGKIMMWSAYDEMNFGGSLGYTQTALYDPNSGQAIQRQVSNGHDMFCPGTSMLADGRILVNGGSNNLKTSLYNFANDQWTIAADMNIGRGYNSTVTLNDGSVFTLGGSWGSGTPLAPQKNGELWLSGNNSWNLLSGAKTDPLLNQDITTPNRSDEHPWVYAAPNGKVFLVGPSVKMTWYDPSGSGSFSAAGNRGDDTYSQVGVSAMFDVGKILKAGGARTYDTAGVQAISSTYVIDINNPNSVQTKKVAPMSYPRAYATSVVLPDGKVMVVGGSRIAKAFDDSAAIYVPELWNPATETWIQLNTHGIARTYHSVALLMPDARVLVAGGGLCGTCGVNHPDGEVFTPPYLYNSDGTLASRPVINSVSASLRYGQSFNVSTSSAVSSFSLVRLSSVTHGMNTDQRLIKLSGTLGANNSYTLTTPAQNVAPPGYWMLFALDARGVPSVAKIIKLQP
ncbi:MAG: RICIN domain-containing protein [Deinococcales bacterium]